LTHHDHAHLTIARHHTDITSELIIQHRIARVDLEDWRETQFVRSRNHQNIFLSDLSNHPGADLLISPPKDEALPANRAHYYRRWLALDRLEDLPFVHIPSQKFVIEDEVDAEQGRIANTKLLRYRPSRRPRP